MWLKPTYFHFQKIEEGATYVRYGTIDRLYFVTTEEEEGDLTGSVEFTLPTHLDELETVAETLKRREIARELHKEFLRIYNVGENIFEERPKSFDLTIRVLAEEVSRERNNI